MTPQFKHDCSNCVFLGITKGRDYYVCVPPPGAPGEGILTIRTSDDPEKFLSMAVSAARVESKAGKLGKFMTHALSLLDLKEQKFSMVIDLTSATQVMLSDLILPKREMGLEEKLLLQNFLTLRMMREYKGVQFTPDVKAELRRSVGEWLKEWELIRA